MQNHRTYGFTSISMARLKRFESQTMFQLVQRFSQQWPSVSSEGSKEASFFVVSRLHACIRSSASAVDFFFTRIHRVDTLRTRAFHFLLKCAVYSRPLQRALAKYGLIDEIIDASVYANVDWEQIDVLFAEWHFVGAFSQSTCEVAHVLGFPEFSDKMKREIEARYDVREIIDVPEIKHHFPEEPAGWVEEIVGERRGQVVSSDDYRRAQERMISLYKHTGRRVEAATYVDELFHAGCTHYENESETALLLFEIRREAQALILNHDIGDLTIARTHGDFKASQLLRYESTLFVVDWSESAYTWIVHDLVSLFMIFHKTFDLSRGSVPHQLVVLYDGLQPELTAVPDKLPFLVTLMEIAVRQRTVFTQKKGPLDAWVGAARKVLS